MAKHKVTVEDIEQASGTTNGAGTAPEPSSDLAAWPKPPAAAAFYGIAGDVVSVVGPQTEADPVAILAQFLVAFGSVIGRHSFYQVEGRRHYPNTYCVLVGRTAKGRKGTAWAWVENVFGLAADPNWLNECVMSGLSSGEGLINAVRDPIGKDDGVTDKRLLAIEEEFASVLRLAERDGSILSSVLRQAWDSGKLRTLTRHAPLRATDAHISIVGHITLQELIRCLSDTAAANGFVNRFLWLCARRSKLLPDGGESVDLSSLADVLEAAIGRAKLAGRLYRSDECRELWHQVYPVLSGEQPGLLGLVTNRAEAQVLRLSLIYALLDGADVIERWHLEAAIALWDYVEASCRYVFGSSTGNRDADELLAAIRSRGKDGMTLKSIYVHFANHKTAEQIARLLSLLAEYGLARREKKGTGGRPSETWFAASEGE